MLFNFKNKEIKEEMYLASCDVFNMKNGRNCRVSDILLKNKKDAEKWMKNIRENYTKDFDGNIMKNWKTVDDLCYEADGMEFYVVEHNEGEFGDWTRHELWYRPIKFVEI